MPHFGPPPHPTQKAPPEVNRFWRRLMWDDELTRLYSHLDEVKHYVDVHQKKLYLENTFHDQARDRATQLYTDRIARENIGLFKRLMAVHTRKPREFITHHVQNPKTHSRFLEYQRVMMDNHRLVDRLLSARTFVNERGSWDDHALEHEKILLRLSHNPKNCFIPNLKAKRRRDQLMLREQSVAKQALAKVQMKPLPQHEQQAKQFERINQIVQESGIQIPATWQGEPYLPREASPKYKYPLPPNSVVTDLDTHTDQDQHANHNPTILLPYGTHLVAPALIDQSQYDSLTESLAGVDLAHPPSSISNSAPSCGARVFATTGELEDALFTIPMPPPNQNGDAASHGQSHASRQEEDVFYLPSASSDRPAEMPYPFKFPPLETRDGIRLQEEMATMQTQQGNSSGRGGHRRGKSSMSGGSTGMYGYGDLSDSTVGSGSVGVASRSDPIGPLSSPASQKFLDYFQSRSRQFDGSNEATGAQTTRRRPHPPASGAGSASARTSATNAHLPRLVPSPPATHNTGGISTPTPRLSQYHYHHDAPSVFARSTSAAASSGPRGSQASRRTHHKALEALLDQILMDDENGADGDAATPSNGGGVTANGSNSSTGRLKPKPPSQSKPPTDPDAHTQNGVGARKKTEEEEKNAHTEQTINTHHATTMTRADAHADGNP